VGLDDVHPAQRGGASFVGAAGAEEVGELEDESDQVDRDQKREEELDVFPDRRVRRLDLLERRLAGEEVAVGLDRGDPVCDLGGLGCLPERDLLPVGGGRRLELRALCLQRRRCGGSAGEVAPE
jgi:hypothetical protein